MAWALRAVGQVPAVRLRWGTTVTGRHFQVLYEPSHFTGQVAAGVMTIHTLRFRGEDFEPNLGQQTFTGITE